MVREMDYIRSATIFGQSIHALVDDRFDVDDLKAQLAQSGIIVSEIRPLQPSLEDVFVARTYKHKAELEAVNA